MELTRILSGIALSAMLFSCGGTEKQSHAGDITSESHDWPDTLRVVTLYSPTSYFLYREQPMGYDYDLVSKLAEDKNIPLKLEVAPNLNRAIEMLDSGKVDLIAYEIPVTAEFKEKVIPCGVERITTQVLVQPRPRGKSELITDVTQLVGKDVYVEADSKYLHRLENLNDELGGGIGIHPITRDTLITEDLIEMVSQGKIPLTIVDSDVAAINKTYYSDLDINLQLSYPQRAQWGVNPDKQWLADSITAWTLQESPKKANAELLKRYFELSKKEPSAITYVFKDGRISPYDELFKKYAADLGWDWRLFASQGYAESHFDNSLVSWAGARGMMQIMPGTARAYGYTVDQLLDNETCIKLAAKIIIDLDKSLSSKVHDPEERKKFVIAAYNSGLAHILDAIALAKKYGLNPEVWQGNVEEAVLMKTKPEYYNDPVCKYGYFHGRQTIEYVRRVYDFYNRCKQNVKI